MATTQHKQAAKKNIQKAQEAWQNMAPRDRAKAQPEGRARAQPGATGKGDYYHIEVRPKEAFTTFRTHDVGEKGGIQRVAGQRRSGAWDDQTWLISKALAHVEQGRLVPDTADAREVLEAFASQPEHIEGDRFQAQPRRNVPEKEKPTAAQHRARQENLKKARAARRTS